MRPLTPHLLLLCLLAAETRGESLRRPGEIHYAPKVNWVTFTTDSSKQQAYFENRDGKRYLLNNNFGMQLSHEALIWGEWLYTDNPEAPVTHGDAGAPVVGVGTLRWTVNGHPASATAGSKLGRVGCEGGEGGRCMVRVNINGRSDLIEVATGDSWEVWEVVGANLTGYKEVSGVTTIAATDAEGTVMLPDARAINAQTWYSGLSVRVPDTIHSLEDVGAARTWAAELHMDALVFQKGGDGGAWGPAPQTRVTVDYPDGEISLNNGQTWAAGHAVREWDNFDGTGWLGLRARTTLTTPGEYLGSLHLTVELL